MDKVSRQLAEMRENPTDVRFADLERVCRRYFGEPRRSSGSHTVFRTSDKAIRASISKTKTAWLKSIT